MIRRYTMSEYLAVARTLNAENHMFSHPNQGSAGWTAGIGTVQAIHLATVGDLSMVKATEECVAKFDSGLEMDRAFKSLPGFVGHVNVPAYLGGSPLCMRSRSRCEASVRHVNVYVNVSTSSGVTVETGLRRGSAILGLLFALQRAGLGLTVHVIAEFDGGTKRPATGPFDRNHGDQYHLITLESPIDLSVASFALAHPAFDRAITFPMATPYGFTGRWPDSHANLGGSYDPRYHDFLRKYLDMGPKDIYVPAAYLHSALEQDPEAWIRQQIIQIMT